MKKRLLSKDNFISKTMEHLEDEVKTVPAFNLGDFRKKVKVLTILLY